MRGIILIFMLVCLLMLVVTGCGEMRTVSLYFLDNQAEYLQGEVREVPRKNFEEYTIIALLEGPQKESLLPLFPPDTTLRGFEMRGKVAVIDFDASIREMGVYSGSIGESLVIQGMANTMASLPTVERIKILIDGQETDTLWGHVDLSTEIEADRRFVQ